MTFIASKPWFLCINLLEIYLQTVSSVTSVRQQLYFHLLEGIQLVFNSFSFHKY